VINGHRKRIFSKNVLQGGDFSKRRGFAVKGAYGWRKTEVIENNYVTVPLAPHAGGFRGARFSPSPQEGEG